MLPGARELGLVDELETGGKLESAPGLVTVGAGIDGMARLASSKRTTSFNFCENMNIKGWSGHLGRNVFVIF